MERNGNDSDDLTRRKMVEAVSKHFADTSGQTGLSQLEDRIREALSRVPRHCFVPAGLQSRAYADSALPIGCGQTISQPFIVALMIQLAAIEPGMRVLEVGTGSGYETALLAEIVDELYSIELQPELADRAVQALEEAGHESIHVRSGDGFEGWPEAAPFDAILVTACAEAVPAPLLEQLAVGGRLVIPVGHQNAYQELQVIEKKADGEFDLRHGLSVAFVPLVHTTT